jgi:hypothetical protein
MSRCVCERARLRLGCPAPKPEESTKELSNAKVQGLQHDRYFDRLLYNRI